MNFKGIIVFLISAIVIGACHREESAVIAEINGLKVTEEQFQKAFRNYYYRTGQAIPINEITRKAVFDNEFNRLVLFTHAKHIGLASDQESERFQGMLKRKVYVDGFKEYLIADTISYTDVDLKILFVDFNTSLRASHLYSKTKRGIDSLYTLLQEGVSFEQLAASSFKNSYLAESHGDVGTFTVDDMDVAFEKAAFALKVGEISKPVKTALGYSIIKLTDKKVKPIITENEFATQKAQLDGFFFKQRKLLAERKHLQTVTEQFIYDEALLEAMWNSIAPNLNQFIQNTDEFSYVSSLPSPKTPILSSNEVVFSIQDLMRELRYTSPEQRAAVKSKELLRDMISGLAYRWHVVDVFSKTKFIKEKEIQRGLEVNFQHYVVNRLEQSVQDTLTILEPELRRLFNEQPERWDIPQQLSVARIIVADLETGENVVKELNRGRSFSEVLRAYTTESEDLLTNGEMGFVNLNDFGILSLHVKDAQPGQIVGPFEYQTGKILVFKVLDRREARKSTFNDVKEFVKEDVKKQKLKLVMNDLVEQIKVSKKAFVDTNKLDNITINL